MTVDYNNDLLLITAAGGKQAQNLLPFLLNIWKRLRLVVLSTSSQERLQSQYPQTEVIHGDLGDPQTCRRVLRGVTACWFVSSGFTRDEVQTGKNMIDAAVEQRRAGGPFEHFVRSSVLQPILRKLVNHEYKRDVEEYLVESGLPFTILQPSHLMDNLNVRAIVEENLSSWPLLWNADVAFSFTSLRDLGEVAARVFEQREKHFFATYQIVSTMEPLSYDQVGQLLAEELGREFRWDRKTVSEGVELMRAVVPIRDTPGDEFEYVHGLARLITYYDTKGLVANSNVTEMLLGHRPLSYRHWVKSVVSEVKT